jgi:hypothetical protein
MEQGEANAPCCGGLGFSVELFITKAGASLDDLAVRPDVVLK